MMEKVVIIIAEDDEGHFELVKRNLWRSCVDCEFMHFRNGQEVLDFFNGKGPQSTTVQDSRYILILDIKMPKVDGREVLQTMKADPQMKKIPVIMLTTTDDPEEVQRCHEIGCSFYIVKPSDYTTFMEAVASLGAFLSIGGIRVPCFERKPTTV